MVEKIFTPFPTPLGLPNLCPKCGSREVVGLGGFLPDVPRCLLCWHQWPNPAWNEYHKSPRKWFHGDISFL